MNDNKLNTPVQYLKGVGPKRAQLLARIGVETVRDLLWLMPRRYEDRSNLKPINQVHEGELLTVMGEVSATGLTRTRRRLTIFKVAVSDGTGIIYATFFNQPYLKEYFKKGLKVVMYGKTAKYKGKQLVMNVPEYEIIPGDELNSIHMGGIVPIYPLTEHLNQRFVRSLVRSTLNDYINKIEENVPEDICTRRNLIPVQKAVWNIHFPENDDIREKSRIRMAFDEFFVLQLGIALKRHYVENFVEGISHKSGGELVKKFKELLPFKLTSAQKKVLGEITNDMQKNVPMSRLLQGDVGSGKTIVALHALLYAVGSGYQGAIMVPTEILARQHYLSIKELIEPLDLKLALLIGDIPAKEYDEVVKNIKEGNVDIVIGTHALIQSKISYNKLGLIVIDEQHKFGVSQRALLGTKAKLGLGGAHPDVLVMTATPIPRSLTLTVYGDMKLSIIDELPPGRGKIVTYWITESKLKKAYDFIRKEISKGHQAFIVYPLVKESEKLDLRAAEDMVKKLQTEEFPKLRLGLIHGRITAEKKAEVMKDFKEGRIHVLVATTVIEVGIDISNATVMLIEHAERFGLSQLHQLRGRIGRGSQFSYCILQGNPGTPEGNRRLKAMEATNDGFKISEEDLAIRGPGEFFGTKQSGMPELKIGNILTDFDLMNIARREAFTILQKDSGLQSPEHRNLFINVKNMFGKNLELVSL